MTVARSSPPAADQPAWEVATLFPNQGNWDETEYLSLTLNSNRLVEFRDGCVEVPPMPKASHQLIVGFLWARLTAFVSAGDLGRVLFAPFRIRLRQGLFREPDIVFMSARHRDRAGDEYWDGADLVMEVVSDDPKDRERDLKIKRAEYALAGIGEYWIVDHKENRITVLKLDAKEYVIHAQGGPGDRVGSSLLEGFAVGVSDVFAAAAKG